MELRGRSSENLSVPKSGKSTNEEKEQPPRNLSSIFLEAVKTAKRKKSPIKAIENYIKEKYKLDIIEQLPNMGIFLRSDNQGTNGPKEKKINKALSGAKKPAAKANVKVAKKATADNKIAKKATVKKALSGAKKPAAKANVKVAKKATATNKIAKKATVKKALSGAKKPAAKANVKVSKKATSTNKIAKKATVGSKAKKVPSTTKRGVVTRAMAANNKNDNNDPTVKEAAGGTKTVEKKKSAKNSPESISRKTSKQDVMGININEGGNSVGSVSDAEAVDDCGHSKWKYIQEAKKKKERREARKRSRSRSKKRKSPAKRKRKSKSPAKRKRKSKSPKKKKKPTAAAPKKKTTKSKKQTGKRGKPKGKKKR